MKRASLAAVEIKELRPTQVSLGMKEVGQKREQWRDHKGKALQTFLSKHSAPTVLGPKGRYYLIDDHHLARAMEDEGVEEMMVTIVEDLSDLPKESFWIYLDNRSWCHPYDENGVRRDFTAIPKALADMKDDPFRSLASALRRAGGFAKDSTPFMEFLWADFLRRRMDRSRVKTDFADAIVEAITLSKSKDAAYLPGWCGPDPI